MYRVLKYLYHSNTDKHTRLFILISSPECPTSSSSSCSSSSFPLWAARVVVVSSPASSSSSLAFSSSCTLIFRAVVAFWAAARLLRDRPPLLTPPVLALGRVVTSSAALSLSRAEVVPLAVALLVLALLPALSTKEQTIKQ